MNEQLKITLPTPTGEDLIMPEDVEKAEKEAEEKKKATNKARAIIKDAAARYIKEKTRARSKKAAEEKDAILKSPRFKALEIYEKREDIMDAYGWDMISISECDRLEELWDEREQIKAQTVNGIYSDLVTELLEKAEAYIWDVWQEDIDQAEYMRRTFDRQRKEADEAVAEWLKKQEESARRAAESQRNG